MEKEYFSEYRRRVIDAARGVALEPADQLVQQLYAEPGWRPVRQAVGRLVGLMSREWLRRRGATSKAPRRSYLPYVRRLPNK